MPSSERLYLLCQKWTTGVVDQRRQVCWKPFLTPSWTVLRFLAWCQCHKIIWLSGQSRICRGSRCTLAPVVVVDRFPNAPRTSSNRYTEIACHHQHLMPRTLSQQSRHGLSLNKANGFPALDSQDMDEEGPWRTESRQTLALLVAGTAERWPAFPLKFTSLFSPW